MYKALEIYSIKLNETNRKDNETVDYSNSWNPVFFFQLDSSQASFDTIIMQKRVKITIRGRVQGVGFRPTVYRYATNLGLTGNVRNTTSGLIIEAEGQEQDISTFLTELQANPPSQSRIISIKHEEISTKGEKQFEIIPSKRSGNLTVGMPPDIATCDDCIAELLNPEDRRYRYPFINCTNCGPRFTIIENLPYDRKNTSMAPFKMCTNCQAEYDNPTDRRFDAQPNACPDCGPSIMLINRYGKKLDEDPIVASATVLAKGSILAVKGLGGYHLACSATSNKSVKLLRERKNRPSKPLAVMFTSVDQAREHCLVSDKEEEMLLSSSRPIVILQKLRKSKLSALISPETNEIGVFLPYTPLHHLLIAEISPLVMTSGNIAEEPISKDEDELDERILGHIADYAIVHDRQILRPCDDSVVKIVQDKPIFFRRSRGITPDEINLALDGPSILACGAEMKNTFCITRGSQAFMSQHIGDLSDYMSFQFYKEQISDLLNLLEARPDIVAHDLHPDYLSTRFAAQSGISSSIAVQHHHAHIVSCMAENGVTDKVIGVALDGTGYGPDNTIWGGEFLVADMGDFQRAAHFKQYPMPGGDEAIRHPSRMALSYLNEEASENLKALVSSLLPDIKPDEMAILLQMIKHNVRCPLTSSAGRLFDTVSCLLGNHGDISYEGQPAIHLQAIAKHGIDSAYDFELDQGADPAIISFGPVIREIVKEIEGGTDRGIISAKFHNTVAEAVACTCNYIKSRYNINKVALSGGVFQNDMLLQLTVEKLAQVDFKVYHHHVVPPNDGGIALGQAAVALFRSKNKRQTTE